MVVLSVPEMALWTGPIIIPTVGQADLVRSRCKCFFLMLQDFGTHKAIATIQHGLQLHYCLEGTPVDQRLWLPKYEA